ncbi:thiamine transport system permease protein [Albidovulum inexpectatum]|uniref:Thiamine transport system permease protein n=1 Tax=Albidovulum inexpectatum TaxID=196587 RepID=A0A2S5JM24_9RHOB|nr:thiamine/thiamine pyrophosphate ABC transporter permease ThiP [Albidovulum inexpectatum]PPB82500.1 thiamine transport system permease protein [Albidovulum inexpectatum]
MASRAQPIEPWIRAAASIAAALVAILTLGTLAAVARRAEGLGGLGSADWAALRFTIMQAGLSAALSVALAVPVARALARRRFPLRRLLITALGAPFILPVIVAVLGILAVFGRSGIVNDILASVGLQRISIYGLWGVVLANVFFNLPFAVRLFLQGWAEIPAERFRLAASLGFSPRDVARHLEWPMLRSRAPGAFATIFLICLTSFAIALTLGGGPRATTIELAIYQAFRFDFDLGRAATLAALQLALCALTALAAARFTLPSGHGAGLDRTVWRWDADRWLSRITDGLVIVAAVAFLLTPLGAVIARGLPALGDLPAPVWKAAGRSLAVALISTGLTVAMALPMALALAARRPPRGLETIGMLPLATSSLVIGTGLFLMLRPVVSPSDLALPVTVAVNAVMALPFCLRVLVPPARELAGGFGRLADSLDMRGWARLQHLTLPRLRAPLGFAAGLTAALSMGDLGVIALFADQDSATLPLQLYRLMGAYRMDQAAGAAVLLLALSFALFCLFDRGARGHA